jgi:hypothetical protein
MAAFVPGRSARGPPFLVQVDRGQGSPEPGSRSMHSTGCVQIYVLAPIPWLGRRVGRVWRPAGRW